MAPKVITLPKDETTQAVKDFVNNTVPAVNIDMESPALPLLLSPQSRRVAPREDSSLDPGPSTRRPRHSLSLASFSDLTQHVQNSILPTLHCATRLLTAPSNPAREPATPSRPRPHGSTSRSDKSLGKSSSIPPNSQGYEWRQTETTDGYCLFDLSGPRNGLAAKKSSTPVVLLMLSPWKYSARDLEDLVTERQTKKSSSRSSSRRSKITPLLAKLATYSQQVGSRHVIISTYEYWSFGRFESNSEYGTLHLTPIMSHDSGDPGMINSRPGASREDCQWPVTVLQASLYWTHQALEASKPVRFSPRKARIAPSSPRKRVRDEGDGDTEDEAEVDDWLQASIFSISSVDQPSPSKRSRRSRLSFADLPSIEEEETSQPSLRRSTRRRSAVQLSMCSSSSTTAVAEKTKPKPTGTRRKDKTGATSTRAESSKRGSTSGARTAGRSKPIATETPVASSRSSAHVRESRPVVAAKVSAPSPKRPRKHAREDDLTDIEDQPSPSKKARIRPPPLALSAPPKSPSKRVRNEPTAIVSPMYVPSSSGRPSATTTRVTRSSSFVKGSSRTLYLERIYVPGTGIAIAESDRWSNQGNLSDRDRDRDRDNRDNNRDNNREWLNSKEDSYQTAVESDDREEEEFYGDVPSPAAMAKLREGSEEYDSGYGRSTSPYVPDEGTLKRLAVRTDHVNDPKSMGSLLKKGSKNKKAGVA